MKVTIAAAISLDAKLTRHDETDIHAWVSDEDQDHFSQLKSDNDVIVFGSNVYEGMKDDLKLDEQTLRVVLTSQTDKYSAQAVAGQLEFKDVSAADLVEELDKRGFDSLLITGGGGMITDFLQAGVANEIYLTLEPRIFGSGSPLIINKPMDMQLELLDSKVVNDQGTIITHYKVC